jgi:hypothetical protein
VLAASHADASVDGGLYLLEPAAGAAHALPERPARGTPRTRTAGLH